MLEKMYEDKMPNYLMTTLAENEVDDRAKMLVYLTENSIIDAKSL